MFMVYCSNCGKELPAEAVFCPKCGTRVGAGAGTPSDEMRDSFTRMSQEMERAFTIAAKEVHSAFQTARNNIQHTLSKEPVVCSKCGEKNPAGASFCSKCGASLSGAQAAEPSEAPKQ